MLRAYHASAARAFSKEWLLGVPQDLVENALRLKSALEAVGRQLPRFEHNPLVPRACAAQPKELGWMNYWSEATCEYIGFPDPGRDQYLLQHSYRTLKGAWLVKLCPDPLDLARPEHLILLADAYMRFPKLGIRAKSEPATAPMPLGYPQNTLFFRETRAWSIVEALAAFLREKGYKPTERIPRRGAERLVTVGVFPGAPDWIVVKSVPPEFWNERAAGSQDWRFVELGRALGRDCLMLDVRNPVEALLAEVSSDGRSHISGFQATTSATAGDASPEPASCSVPEFRLLPIELDVFDLDNSAQIAEQLYAELGGSNADVCDNDRFQTLLEGNLLQERRGFMLRFLPD